jgi:hypothetical protein
MAEQATPALHWYRCNTHTHTASFPTSDANASPEYVVGWYKKHGYQCLAITDHEHLTQVDFLNRKFGADGQFLAIRGEEITQGVHDATHGDAILWGHVNGINTNQVIYPLGWPEPLPPNIPPEGQTYFDFMPHTASLAQTYTRNVDKIYSASGIPQINHPSGLSGTRLEDLLPLRRPFLFEVWNGFPLISPLGGQDETGRKIPSFEALWDSLLSAGKTAWAVAADDAHDYFNFDDPGAPTPGKAWIMVQAPELTLEAIMDSLRHGRFYASTGISLTDYHADRSSMSIDIDLPSGWKSSKHEEPDLFTTAFIGQDGRVLAVVAGRSPRYRIRGDEKYVRASITDSNGRRAWTQPIFLDGRLSEIK